ncbi:seipin-like, partial [Anser cygnoides]|uniref:seipin-like n=1 Tax=Anser cygnoides TaxID=8845 RepID=UPI0034D3870C
MGQERPHPVAVPPAAPSHGAAPWRPAARPRGGGGPAPLLPWVREAAAAAGLGLRRAALRGAVALSAALLLLWGSVFLYGSFYYAYMPAASFVTPVHYSFRTDCTPRGPELCSFPTANVSLLKPNRERALSPGQLYRIALELEVPESPANRQLGMFLVAATCYTRGGRAVASATRAAMLRYRSGLLRALEAVAFAGLFLAGAAEQKQTLEVELSPAYREDPYAPTLGALLEIRSRRLQLYGARLRVHAHFSGLRYLLYHFPLTSALLGIATNFAFLGRCCCWAAPGGGATGRWAGLQGAGLRGRGY